MAGYLKIVVFVPISHAEAIRNTLAQNGCGKMGTYDFCSFSVKGIGRFRPLKGSKPFIGKNNAVTRVEEERIETICPRNKLKAVLAAVKKAHPYEHPAIDIFALL